MDNKSVTNSAWSDRQSLAKKAKEHVEKITTNEKIMKYVDESIKSAIFYPADSDIELKRTLKSGKINIVDATSVEGVFIGHELGGKTCVLNFANYVTPGGCFLDGSKAQEEFLCHGSAMYNIIASQRCLDLFYKPHIKHENEKLFSDDILYLKEVPFFSENIEKYPYNCLADVIVCAAPNLRHSKASPEYVSSLLLCRIDKILASAAINGVDNIILGAFGCGIFANNPHMVSSVFNTLLNHKYKNVFNNAIFAIPGGENFEIFKKEIPGISKSE